MLLPHHINVMCLDFAVSLASPLMAVAKPPAVGPRYDTRADAILCQVGTSRWWIPGALRLRALSLSSRCATL